MDLFHLGVCRKQIRAEHMADHKVECKRNQYLRFKDIHMERKKDVIDSFYTHDV